MKRLELIISLDNICYNAHVIRSMLPQHVKMFAVVKANAYGHGAVETAHALERMGTADAYAVATPDEGALLRESGVDKPVIVLGAADEQDVCTSVRESLSQAIFDTRGLRMLESEARKQNRAAFAHLKADTGMSRIGVRNMRQLDDLLEAWRDCPHVDMKGMFTHFCAADEDEAFTEQQFRTFMDMAGRVREKGFAPVLHAAASTAMLKAEYALDMVRAGIALYGTGVKELAGKIKPAQTLITHPVRVEWIETGETVGYSRKFRAQRPTRVMTVPCGYGDGYPRILGGRADVLVNGRRAPVIGNVCMDMMMADVTDAGDIDLTTPVVLMGTQGGETITPDELAEKAETIPYEIMLGFGSRVARSWIQTTECIMEDRK